jgi:hypothetical protein
LGSWVKWKRKSSPFTFGNTARNFDAIQDPPAPDITDPKTQEFAAAQARL